MCQDTASEEFWDSSSGTVQLPLPRGQKQCAANDIKAVDGKKGILLY